MASESKAHTAFGLMRYWIRAHSGSRNNCYIIKNTSRVTKGSLMWSNEIILHFHFHEGSLIRGFTLLIDPTAMPCWWAPTRAKQLSMAATARVIWLCACVRYWPYCGVGRCAPLLSIGIVTIYCRRQGRKSYTEYSMMAHVPWCIDNRPLLVCPYIRSRISCFVYCIECFHSRGQHLCKFIRTKESICIRKEYNSQRIGLGHQHGRRFIVLGH